MTKVTVYNLLLTNVQIPFMHQYLQSKISKVKN